MASKLQQAIDNTLGRPYFIAEIGVNWNGDFQQAIELISLAKQAGADCVKFQKRTPVIHVWPDDWEVERSSPAGREGVATKLQHRQFMEFDHSQMARIRSMCRQTDIEFFYSVFDIPSVALMDDYREVVAIKIPSPANDNYRLIKYARQMANRMQVPLLISTGMTTNLDIAELAEDADVLFHTVSKYPTPDEECHIANVDGQRIIGYSGHEMGYIPTLMAIDRGARIIERHFTKDTNQPGSDHQSSLDPTMFHNMVEQAKLRGPHPALGVKRSTIYECEKEAMERLR